MLNEIESFSKEINSAKVEVKIENEISEKTPQIPPEPPAATPEAPEVKSETNPKIAEATEWNETEKWWNKNADRKLPLPNEGQNKENSESQENSENLEKMEDSDEEETAQIVQSEFQ